MIVVSIIYDKDAGTVLVQSPLPHSETVLLLASAADQVASLPEPAEAKPLVVVPPAEHFPIVKGS